MLSELVIENFAIIDRLLLRLDPGFTVLTGETGAGKSIIIDALQSALGARVPTDVVRGDARFAAVEAIFERGEADGDDAARTTLEEYGIEEEGCLILRREIGANGRSTARVNGRAVPLSVLTTIGSAMVDIHGQSDHLSILRRDRQLEVLDRFGGLLSLRAEVADAVKELNRVRNALAEVSGGQREAERRLDLLRFQVQEIESAQLSVDEEEDVEVERNLLVSAERRTQLSVSAHEALQGESGAALDGVVEASSALRELAGIDPVVGELSRRLDVAQLELADIAGEVRQYRDRVEFDPRRLDSIEERIDLLTRLKRKYGSTVAEVIAFGKQARAEKEGVENLDERLTALADQVEEAESMAAEMAANLSSARQRAADALSGAMADAMQDLGLKGTSFEVELSCTPAADGLTMPDGIRCAFTQSGVDVVSFRMSFNPGEPVRPLERVASGGETSRFLLALKSVLASADRTPTLIFDEVDVGVGGRRGLDVGERMRALARDHQVISITHLPQIAALAEHHITVEKAVRDGRTTVAVRSLEAADRVVEIAEMMSGTETEAARRNAQELLEAAQRAR